MKHLIDKDALVAKIDRLQDSTMDEDGNFYSLSAQVEYNVLCMLENFINTLEVKEMGVDLGAPDGDTSAEYIVDTATFEVKEVDLGFQRFAKEMDAIFALPSSETKNTEENLLNWEYAIAKHFFELGLKSKGE